MLSASIGNTSSWPQVSGYYWQQSRRPLVCLSRSSPRFCCSTRPACFLASVPKRCALTALTDVWLRQLLDLLGFGQYFLLPLLTVAILLGWHHTTRQTWQVVPNVLYAMFTECLLLAVALVVIARLQGALWSMFIAPDTDWPVHAALTAAIDSDSWSGVVLGATGKIISFCGAGIYEEVLFRLMMLPLVAWALRWAGCGAKQSLIAAVAITSLVFSAAHYIGPHGQTFEAATFLFRFIAGAFFAVLFVYRGFGIAAGTHAFYDILVGLLLTGSAGSIFG